MIHKNTTVLLAGLASAAFMLAACTTDETAAPVSTQTKTGIDITSEAQMNAGITIGDTQAAENARKELDAIATQQKESKLPPQIAVEDPFQPVPEALSAADEAAYASAKQLNDPSQCDKMSSEQLKNQCKTDLANLNLQAEAQQNISAGEELPMSEDEKLRTEAVSKLDLTMCAQITTAQVKQACDLEVILQKWIADPGYCKTLTDPDYQNICKGIEQTQTTP